MFSLGSLSDWMIVKWLVIYLSKNDYLFGFLNNNP